MYFTKATRAAILGTIVVAAAGARAQIPSGAHDGAWIKKQKYLNDGGSAKMVSDPQFGQVLQTTIRPPNGKRSEYVVHRIGSGKHVRYEFHAKYIDGKGALINQWHHPTGDGAGPGACLGVLKGGYQFAYFENNQRKGSDQIIPIDNKWHTWRLDACWSRSNGYLYLYLDGKPVFTMNGNNMKKTAPSSMGASFKLGCYSQAKDLVMQYAWTRIQSLSGPAKKPGSIEKPDPGDPGTDPVDPPDNAVDFTAPHVKLSFGGLADGWSFGDGFVQGGQSFTFSGMASVDGVTDPAPEAVYNSVIHRGSSTEDLVISLPDVPDGACKLRFHVADQYGDRAIDIAAEGKMVVENLDPITEGGGEMKAVVKEATVTVSDGNGLEIVLSDDRAEPKDVFLGGLEIISGTAPAVPVIPYLDHEATRVRRSKSAVVFDATGKAHRFPGILPGITIRVSGAHRTMHRPEGH